MISTTQRVYDAAVALLSGRDPRWPALRRAHLAKYPGCAACGNTRSVEVHHVEPVSVKPSRELDPENLLTLCTDGPGGMNCHLVIGHCGRWDRWNDCARFHAARFRLMFALARSRDTGNTAV